MRSSSILNQPTKMFDSQHPIRPFIRRLAVANILAFLLSIVVLVQSNWAQTAPSLEEPPADLKQLSLAQLGDVEVTSASKEPEQVWRTPAAIYVITREDIRRSGATSLPEVLRLAPGVEVARIDSDHWAVGIRGFASGFSKSVLVLIDGRSVYTPLYAGVYWDVQNVMLEDVERIEVIRGPGGTIWGANAVNGVINIITKNAKDTHGSLASFGGGNVDQGTGSFRFGGGNGSTFDYRVYGMAFGRGPEFHSDQNQFDDWQLGQAGFRTDWKRKDRDTFTLQGDLYNGREGQLVNIAYLSPPASINVLGTQRVSGGNLLGHWRRQLSEKSDLQVQAYYDRTFRTGPQLEESRNTFDVDFIHHMALPWRQDFIWGLGVRLSPDNFTQTVATVDFIPHHQLDSIYTGFVQDEIGIVPNQVSLIIGTKLEDNNFSGFDAQPSARILWTLRPHHTLWAAVTRAVRTPSRIDQDLQLTGYAPTVPFFIHVVGDPTFVPEQLIGYEAGYRALLAPRFYCDLSAFYNDYNNLTSFGTASFSIEGPPAPPDLSITIPWANGIKGFTRGFEIAPDWKVTSWWQLKGSYSYLHLATKDKPGYGDAGTVASDNGSSPHHEVIVQSPFTLPKRFELDPTYRYLSSLPAQRVTAYSTADLQLSWHAGKEWDLAVVGQNLVEPHHAEFGGGPGPIVQIKRSVYGKLTWVHEPR